MPLAVGVFLCGARRNKATEGRRRAMFAAKPSYTCCSLSPKISHRYARCDFWGPRLIKGTPYYAHRIYLSCKSKGVCKQGCAAEKCGFPCASIIKSECVCQNHAFGKKPPICAKAHLPFPVNGNPRQGSRLRFRAGGKGECAASIICEHLKAAQRKNRTQSRQRSANVGFFMIVTKNLRTLFANFCEYISVKILRGT